MMVKAGNDWKVEKECDGTYTLYLWDERCRCWRYCRELSPAEAEDTYGVRI